jgi:hypothetical protein
MPFFATVTSMSTERPPMSRRYGLEPEPRVSIAALEMIGQIGEPCLEFFEFNFLGGREAPVTAAAVCWPADAGVASPAHIRTRS